jgi:hypothetical protein
MTKTELKMKSPEICNGSVTVWAKVHLSKPVKEVLYFEATREFLIRFEDSTGSWISADSEMGKDFKKIM